MAGAYHLDPVMAEHKRRVHVELLRRWCSPENGARVLKTDLFEEALGPDEVLLSWPADPGSARLSAIDVSEEVCARARGRLRGAGREIAVARADATRLPFADGTFDIVFSCSTLDHFGERESLHAGLREAARVLRAGGDLVLVLDNPRALFYPLVRRLERRGRIGFRLGETLAASETRAALADLGLEVVEQRGLYRVPRVFFTALLRFVRAARLGILGGPLLRLLARVERSGKAPDRSRAWYVATLAKKPGQDATLSL
jgi:SAM-dependent methyltransferase